MLEAARLSPSVGGMMVLAHKDEEITMASGSKQKVFGVFLFFLFFLLRVPIRMSHVAYRMSHVACCTLHVADLRE